MIDYKIIENKLTDCNMNKLLKDKRIENIIKEHKDICPYVIKINDNYKCKLSIHKDLKNYWED